MKTLQNYSQKRLVLPLICNYHTSSAFPSIEFQPSSTFVYLFTKETSSNIFRSGEFSYLLLNLIFNQIHSYNPLNSPETRSLGQIGMSSFYFMFALLLVTAQAQDLLPSFNYYNNSAQNYEDYCSLIEVATNTPPYDATPEILTIGTSAQFTQTSCAAFYTVTLESSDINKNLVLELKVQYPQGNTERETRLLIGYKSSEAPSLVFNSEGKIMNSMEGMDDYGIEFLYYQSSK